MCVEGTVAEKDCTAVIEKQDLEERCYWQVQREVQKWQRLHFLWLGYEGRQGGREDREGGRDSTTKP